MCDDAQNPNEYEEDAMGGNVRIGNVETVYNVRRFQYTPPDFAATMRSLRVEMQSHSVDNERLVKELEEQNQLNAAILQSLKNIQRWMNSGDRTVRPEGSKSTTRRRKRSPSGSYDSEGSTGGSSSSSHKNQRKKRYPNHSCDEFKKTRPPTFNGEVKNGQEDESWLLGMRKYFQVQYYSGNMKDRVVIFNLIRRESMWWEYFKKVKKINGKKIAWK